MAIHQEVTFNCGADKIYSALTSSEQFATVTGAAADITNEDGGAFSCFDGQITGRNLELNADAMIIQAWRVAAWPQGVYSIVRFALEGSGDQTTVTLDQAGHPDDFTEHLESGWHKMYWDPLKAYCEAD